MEQFEDIQKAADDSLEIKVALEKLAEAAEKLLKSGLTRKALVILLQSDTRVRVRDINLILDALPKLTKHTTKSIPIGHHKISAIGEEIGEPLGYGVAT